MKYFLRLGFVALVSGIVSGSFIACSDDDNTPVIDPPASPDASGGRDGSAEDASDANATDAHEAGDAATDAPTPTRRTEVTAAINSVSRSLDRAQFGDEKNEAGVQLFHVEAHSGGDPACPSSQSPSTDRTLIVTNIPRGAAGTTYTRDDGVRVSYLDFVGDQLPDPPFSTRATALTVTIVAIGSEATPADIELDVTATFPDGTVTGRVFATHCESMDQ